MGIIENNGQKAVYGLVDLDGGMTPNDQVEVEVQGTEIKVYALYGEDGTRSLKKTISTTSLWSGYVSTRSPIIENIFLADDQQNLQIEVSVPGQAAISFFVNLNQLIDAERALFHGGQLYQNQGATPADKPLAEWSHDPENRFDPEHPPFVPGDTVQHGFMMYPIYEEGVLNKTRAYLVPLESITEDHAHNLPTFEVGIPPEKYDEVMAGFIGLPILATLKVSSPGEIQSRFMDKEYRYQAEFLSATSASVNNTAENKSPVLVFEGKIISYETGENWAELTLQTQDGNTYQLRRNYSWEINIDGGLMEVPSESPPQIGDTVRMIARPPRGEEVTSYDITKITLTEAGSARQKNYETARKTFEANFATIDKMAKQNEYDKARKTYADLVKQPLVEAERLKLKTLVLTWPETQQPVFLPDFQDIHTVKRITEETGKDLYRFTKQEFISYANELLTTVADKKFYFDYSYFWGIMEELGLKDELLTSLSLVLDMGLEERQEDMGRQALLVASANRHGYLEEIQNSGLSLNEEQQILIARAENNGYITAEEKSGYENIFAFKEKYLLDQAIACLASLHTPEAIRKLHQVAKTAILDQDFFDIDVGRTSDQWDVVFTIGHCYEDISNNPDLTQEELHALIEGETALREIVSKLRQLENRWPDPEHIRQSYTNPFEQTLLNLPV